ncbi:DUF1361 domain-containing protein [Owenweeksia hongkongensis]|uniref:DUF1361 domain-containing protein n=1 Tax=Owenweeksia hongkongensis TaxID=253245 RepID=UPI003A8DB7F5
MSKPISCYNWLIQRQSIVFSIILCMALITARVLYTSSILYLFLVWNLILAGIPYLLLEKLKTRNRMKLSTISLSVLLILFLPNAPYITTDLFHLRGNFGDSIWYDTLLILSFAWSGLLLFFHSLNNINAFMRQWLPHGKRVLLLVAIILLCAYGIYIGRYLRFNSWDVVSNPFSLLSQMLDHVMNPFSHPRTWGMTLLYGAFLGFSYLSFSRPKEMD